MDTYPRFFKHMRAEHAAAALNTGTVRVGSLFDFRHTERFVHGIGDAAEGYRIDEYPKDVAFTDENQPDWSKRSFKLAPGASLKIQSYGIRHKITSDNYWIFSLSESMDAAIGRRMCPEYDACIEVIDVRSFLACVSAALPAGVRFEGLFRCIYEPRSQDGDTRARVHPALLKNREYEYQQEIRAVWWTSNQQSMEPTNVTHLALGSFCRRIR